MFKLLAFPMRVPAAIRLWVVAIMLVVTAPCIADQPYRLRIGDQAPDIELTRLDGGHLRLAQLQRQALAVTFYRMRTISNEVLALRNVVESELEASMKIVGTR
jgi:hypothetical protein